MDLLRITAIDRHSSDTMSRTLSTNTVDEFKDSVKEFENDIPYSRYELMTDELVEEYPNSIVEVLEELDITF